MPNLKWTQFDESYKKPIFDYYQHGRLGELILWKSIKMVDFKLKFHVWILSIFRLNFIIYNLKYPISK